MRLSQKTVDDVKHFQGIVEVISEYLPLHKRGRNYIGLCPFHSEKSPSFTVSPEKQIWHCFGCHESGDLIAFVQKTDNLSFTEAITLIAEKAGIPVEEDTSHGHTNHHQDDIERKKVFEFLHALSEAWITALEKAPTARTYLAQRNLTPETIKTFKLGFASPDVNLLTLAEQKHLSAENLSKTGVFFKSDQGTWGSRFKGRIMFPVLDYQGRVVGFGGRILQDQQNTAKYINSEETPYFNKRNLIYGLYWAKNAIKTAGHILLMEGYMDVITAHQFGFKQAVASMGTAITYSQAQKLKRFSDTIYLVMDSDEAGQQAIERSFEVLHQVGFKVLIIQLPAKDPADVLQEQGPDVFQACIDQADAFVLFKFKRVLERLNPSRIEQVPQIIDAIIPYLKLETDPIIARHYTEHIAKTLKIDSELIVVKMKKSRYNVSQRLDYTNRATKNRFEKAEEVLIYLMVSNTSLRSAIKERLSSEEFVTQKYKYLAENVYHSTKQNRALLEEVSEEIATELRRIIVEVEQKQLADEVSENWESYVDTVRSYYKESRIQEIKDQLKVLEKQGREDELVHLLEELQRLKLN